MHRQSREFEPLNQIPIKVDLEWRAAGIKAVNLQVMSLVLWTDHPYYPSTPPPIAKKPCLLALTRLASTCSHSINIRAGALISLDGPLAIDIPVFYLHGQFTFEIVSFSISPAPPPFSVKWLLYFRTQMCLLAHKFE